MIPFLKTLSNTPLRPFHDKLSHLILLSFLAKFSKSFYDRCLCNGNRTEWSSVRSVIIRVFKKNWMTAKRESYSSITSMITARIGRHKVLLPINHHCYNFRKHQIHLGQICDVQKMSKKKIPQLWKFHNFFRLSGCCYGYCDLICDWWI